MRTIRRVFLAVSFAAAFSPLVASASRTKPYATGLACYEGYYDGNRGLWIEVDRYQTYMMMISLGGLDDAFRQQLFPDVQMKNPNPVVVYLAVPFDSCEFDGKGALLSCRADHATAPTATVSYFESPDAITVQRSFSVSRLELEVRQDERGSPELVVALEGEERGRKVSLALQKGFATLWNEPLTEATLARPSDGCALAVNVRL